MGEGRKETSERKKLGETVLKMEGNTKSGCTMITR